MLCYQCQSLQLLDNPTQRRDYTIQDRVIVSNSCQSSQDTRPTSWGGLNQRWWVQSWWPIRSKPAVLPVLRARGKCAVVREEISKRGKLLRCLCALTRTVKTLARPPVQVSAADSWGFPDIDLFFIRVLSSTYTTLYDWCALQHRRCAKRVYTDARTPWPHSVYSRLNVMLTARFQTELQRGSPLSTTCHAVSLLSWKSSRGKKQNNFAWFQ